MTEPALRRYTFKLYPTAAQADALDRQRIMAAQLWNALLEQREIQWAHECQRKPKGERRGLNYMRDQSPEIAKLRAACPEWQEPASAMLHKVAQNLDEAFRAFFRRATAGAGASSGYPRYKSVRYADGIPFRSMSNGGWRLEGRSGRNWRLFVKGVPGLLKLRGQFPAAPESIRNMDLMLRDGAWWMSVCVRIERRRAPGSAAVMVRLDLIDAFARVERVDGGRTASSEERSPEGQSPCGDSTFARARGQSQSAREGGERGEQLDRLPVHDGASQSAREGGERGRSPAGSPGDGRSQSAREDGERGSDARPGSDQLLARRFAQVLAVDTRADVVQSEGDSRHRKFSNRWRRARKAAADLRAKAKRIRRDALHVWSSATVGTAAALTVVTPAVREVTASPRGSEHAWGAAVETVSALNRNTLSQAPALAVQMLSYKSAEAGIEFVQVKDEEPVTAVGRDLVTLTKTTRRAKRALRKAP